MGESQAGVIRVPSMRRRFVAFVIDLFIASFLLTMGLGAYVTYVEPEGAGRGALLVLVAVALVVNVLPTAFAGGSLGQLALGLRVARLDGRRLSVPHTLVRPVTFVVYFPWGRGPRRLRRRAGRLGGGRDRGRGPGRPRMAVHAGTPVAGWPYCDSG